MPAANEGGARWGPGTPYAPPPPLSSASPPRRPKPTPKRQIVVGIGFGLVTGGIVLVGSLAGTGGYWIALVALAGLAWVAGAGGYGPGAVFALMGAIVLGILFGVAAGARVDAENSYSSPDGGPSTYAELTVFFSVAIAAIGVSLAWVIGWVSRRLWFKSHS